ncbi:hypothetical protein T492DRAFT_593338 [Pavlovales sp. CCMP2436]|nr:hypothetical protein T492DRAFT_593338 [Pavlovales sp. CCMP2436]
MEAGGGAPAAAAAVEGVLEPVAIIDKTGEALVAIGESFALPPSLTELHLSHNRIAAIDQLDALALLRVLNLRSNQIGEICGLDGCASLRELDLYENQLSEIRGLERCPELRVLDLSFNQLRSLALLPAQGLSKLAKLFAPQNKLERIEGLEGLAQLQTLELGSNRIRTIEALAHLGELRELHLGRNKIASLSGLEGLRQLRILGLSSNRLQALGEGLAGLVALEELYVAHNGLSSFVDLPRTLTRLRVLDAAGNRIEAVAELTPFPLLEDLWLNDNCIGTMAAAAAVAASLRLQTLYLEGNPLAQANDAYAVQLLAFAPASLRQLDAIVLAPDWVCKVSRSPPPPPEQLVGAPAGAPAEVVAE